MVNLELFVSMENNCAKEQKGIFGKEQVSQSPFLDIIDSDQLKHYQLQEEEISPDRLRTPM